MGGFNTQFPSNEMGSFPAAFGMISRENQTKLVGGFNHFIFSIIYGIILPMDSYFSRWFKPPTRYFLMFPDVSYGQSTDNPLNFLMFPDVS
jgi:hypothetical protein